MLVYFFNMFFLSIYTLFQTDCSHFVFGHFSYNVNIALILIDVHYFEAESSEKNQLLQAKSTKLLIVLENRWRLFSICLSPKLCEI